LQAGERADRKPHIKGLEQAVPGPTQEKSESETLKHNLVFKYAKSGNSSTYVGFFKQLISD
jgi:hypothetical protein